jgi:uncharacterized membrane protein YdjX (TVP38/TMEM64 family)
LLQEKAEVRLYSMIAVLLFGSFLILFLLAEALNITLLKEPFFWLSQTGVLAGFTGVCLLVADVALPVPSSLVMIVHGALFGVVIGTLLSLVGSTGAALVGFAIGRRGGPLLVWLAPAEELVQAERLLIRWGMLAIIVTRPVPLLAETTAIVVGTSRLGWGRATLAALAGSLPGALLYALTGAGTAGFQNGALVFGLVLLMASSFWLVGRWLESRLVKPESERT